MATKLTGGGMTMNNIQYLFFNASPNNGNLYSGGGTMYMNNYAGDILIDTHAYGLNIYGAGMNLNLPATLQGSSYLDLNGKTVYGAEQIGFFYGGTLLTAIPGGHTQADITLTGNGGDSAITLTNGTAEIQINAPNDLVITPATGQSILLNGPVKSVLSATAITQPVIQYGEDSGSGTSGNITIAIPVAYTSATSYVAFASVMDGTACKISVTRDSASQITIYWDAAGSGTLPIAWNTMGI